MALIDEEQIPGAGGGSATFDDGGSYDPDGTIVRREWTVDGEDAGRGATLDTQLAPGEHTVTLRVVDDDGLDDTATTTVEVPETAVTGGCSSDCANLNVIGISMTGDDAYVAAPGETIDVEPSVTWEGTTSAEYNTVRSKFEDRSATTSSGASGSDSAIYRQQAGTTVDYTAQVGWVSSLTTAWRPDSYTSTVRVIADRKTRITSELTDKNANIGPDVRSTDVVLSVNAEDKDGGLIEYDWSVSGDADIYPDGDGSATLVADSEGEYTVTVTAKGRTPDGKRGVLASSTTSSADVTIDKIEATRDSDSNDSYNDDPDTDNEDSAQDNGQAGDTDETSGSGSGLVSGWF